MFSEEIRARYIRIIPTGYRVDRPGLRIELIGCNGKVVNTLFYLFVNPFCF